MALIHSFETTGNRLFRKRGIIPLYILILALPILLFGNQTVYNSISAHTAEYIVKPIVAVISILISLLGLGIRCYAIGTTPHGTSGRNTEKQVAKQLNTAGIYSVVRHPLYLGNYLMWAGFLIFTLDILLLLSFRCCFGFITKESCLPRSDTSKNSSEISSWSGRLKSPFIPSFKKETIKNSILP